LPPELGQVGAFQLTDQGGNSFGSAGLTGTVWVAAFMFTRCPTVCPKITKQMRELQVIAQARGLKIRFVSFSVDPEHDTPSALKAYGERFGADFKSWSFLTGDYEVVKRTTVEGFKMALEGKADPGQDHFGILHGSHLVLVDKAGKLRGYYRANEADAMAQLLSDAARLGA
jgi:protein SCO1/2